ncbi:MAG: sensor signal transduction histidine kinase, partial [Bacteroidota bacterium]|nr:sensor signal transduction histidine kinase [Bacteroidota bacterium]
MTTRQRNNIPSAPGVSIATAYSVVAFVSTFLFGFIYYFLAVNMFMSTVLLVVAVLLVINYMMLRQTGNFERTVNVILGLGLIVMILLFATGGWQNTGYLWPIAFLPFVILLGKRKNAIFWALSLFIGCIAAVGLDAVHIISIPYNRVELFNYFGALTTFVAFIYVYHRATVDYEDFLSYTGSLLEANTDPFFTINNDGTIADVNKAAEKYTGLNRAELIGSVFAGYFTDARQVAEICQKVFSGDRAHNYPLSLKSKDGNVAPIILSATLYRDESTKTLRVFATARDVTEQTQAELALRESEERFRLLVEGVRDYAILMLDVDGNIKSWNNGAERIKGYQANEIIGKNMSVFYTEEAIKNFEPERNLEMVRKKGSFENVGWRVKKDGTLFWADVVFTALYNDTGELRGFTKVTRDITEKRNAEEAIIRQAALVQVLPDAIVYGEKEGLKITHMNEAAEHMFGVTLAEAIGEKLDDFVGIVPVGATREEVGKAVWTGDGYWRGEAVFTLKNGKRLNILGTSKTIKDYKGEPTRWMGVFSDITSIKETEERLQIALDGMAAGLWEWKISEDKRWWSPKYFELLGYANNEIEPSSATLKVLLHPDDAALAFGTINAHLTQTQGFKIEVRYKTKEGIYKWYQVSGKTHFDEGSRALRMVGVLIDIDEKKRAEIIIRQQAALIQMLPDGIIYGDMNSRIVSMNAGAESLFEMKAEDAVGKTIDDLISFKLKGITREASGIELRSKGFVRMEAEMISPSG